MSVRCSHRLLIDILHDELECGTFYPPDSLEQLINIYATQHTSIQHSIVSFTTNTIILVAVHFITSGIPKEFLNSP